MRALGIRYLLIYAVISVGVAYGQTSPSVPIQSLSPSEPAATNQTNPDQPGAPEAEGAENTVDPASLIPDLPKLPPAEASLIGGTIGRLDRVQDQLTIDVFGGGRIKTLFDPRTRVFRDGKPASTADLKTGERIYVDTILAKGNVFARNIRISGASAEGESQGVVVSYRQDDGTLLVRDLLAPGPMRLRVTSASRILHNGQHVTTGDLAPGTLVALKFEPEPGGRSIAREISILITPGTQFSFSGQVIFLDLRNGLLVVNSSADHKNHEIHFDPNTLQVSQGLHEGAQVTVLTRYDGNQYVARGLTVEPNPIK
jgi:hypothetical protein